MQILYGGVIPAKAGIHLDLSAIKKCNMDSRFRGNDGAWGFASGYTKG